MAVLYITCCYRPFFLCLNVQRGPLLWPFSKSIRKNLRLKFHDSDNWRLYIKRRKREHETGDDFSVSSPPQQSFLPQEATRCLRLTFKSRSGGIISTRLHVRIDDACMMVVILDQRLCLYLLCQCGLIRTRMRLVVRIYNRGHAAAGSG